LDKAVLKKLTAGTLNLSTQLKWCRQLTEALRHIYRHGYGEDRPSFYSELKPNNVFITEPEEDVLLLDFEQKEGWEEYTAPEVLHHKPDKHRGYEINKYAYDGAVFGFHDFYAEVKQKKKELATVFSLGRVLCGILDGSGCVSAQVTEKGKRWKSRLKGEHGPAPEIPRDLRNLVYAMVTRYPNKTRPTLAKVLVYFQHYENSLSSNQEKPMEAENKRGSFCGSGDSVRCKCERKRNARILREIGLDIGPLDQPTFFARDTVREAARNKWLPVSWKSVDKVSPAFIQQTRHRRAHMRRLLRLKRKMLVTENRYAP
jgi:serine/threonine protein kinase